MRFQCLSQNSEICIRNYNRSCSYPKCTSWLHYGPVTCSVTEQRYRIMLLNLITPQLQQRRCLQPSVSMEDGAPSHIGFCAQQDLRQHSTDKWIFSREFPCRWPSRSSDRTPCVLWLWGHLTSMICKENGDNLPTLKDPTTLKVIQTNR
ncbi:hypothetical protein AVEN_233104-1 [Araneus ventricosus]|uniref:Uncharacterized protein n=1 Tax=Araneus ventricosus TaxID=182803 RepID=A0A4Y2PAY1_ARAVE|nr:hypothetical protein AVEN_233104-1 [Araneus ventricosus]